MTSARQQSNFSQLKAHDEQLERLGLLAERYFADDPNTCLLKLRQLTEGMAQSVASRVGIYTSADERQIDLLRRLQDHGILPREIGGLFHEVRKAGNDANHNLAGDHRTALMAMRLSWQLGIWFHRTFKEPGFKPGPFIPPTPPADESVELKAELETLQRELIAYRTAHLDATQALAATQARVQQTEEERAFWETMATEAETAKHALAQRLEATQAQASIQPPQAVAQLVEAANTAAATLKLSEADTRKIIDAQLAAAGWSVDSVHQTFAKGARPQRGKNLAIAEWPTETGPADYALFIGLQPAGLVEAKRKHLDVSAALQQPKRYSRGFNPSPETELPATNYGADGEFRVPFVFSSNGRPYLSRPFTGQFARLNDWFAMHEEALFDALGESLILFGEWVAAVHSLEYLDLPDYFLAFDVYDRSEKRFWSTARRDALFTRLGLNRIHEIGSGDHQLSAIKQLLLTASSAYRHGACEGVYLRQEDNKWLTARAKLVHPDFVQNIGVHWRSRALRWNVVKPALPLVVPSQANNWASC